MTGRMALLALLVVLVPAAGFAKPSAKWMAHCAANLKGEGNLKGKGKTAKAVRIYCACMDGLDDEAATRAEADGTGAELAARTRAVP